MKKVITLCLIAAAVAAHGETWYIDAAAAKAHATAKNKPFAVPSVWTNAAGEKASTLLATDTLIVMDGVQLNYSGDMAAPAPLHLGAAGDGPVAVLHQSSGTLTADLFWHNGQIETQQYNKNGGISGTVTVDGSEQGAAHVWCYNKVQKTATYDMSWGLSASLSGDAQQVVQFLYAPGSITSEPVPVQQLPVTGDNVEWLGQFTVSSYANFILGHANAAGPASVPRTDAIVLGDHARFAVPVGVTPNAARGISITGTDVRFLTQTYPYALSGCGDCTDYTLNMPISGMAGFAKTGSGRVALGGAYTAGEIVVEEGTLEILGMASVAAATPILVKSGAHLVSHISLSKTALTVEEGGSFERVIDPFVVSFDSEQMTTTPCVLPDDIVELAQTIPFALSESIPLPQHDAHKLAVFTYDGADTLTPQMFVNETDKTCGLPKDEITVEGSVGAQTVYLNTRPVIVSRAKIPSQTGVNINGTAETWSDMTTVHLGADYLLTNGWVTYNGSANIPFAGDSLTIAGEDVNSKASVNLFETSTGEAIVLYPPFTTVQSNSGGRHHVYDGKFFLAGIYDSIDGFTFETTYQDPARQETGNYRGSAELRADLTGEGALFVKANRVIGLSCLTGDNGSYRGRIVVTGHKNDMDNGLFMEFGAAVNLGGELDELHMDALSLAQHAFLYPTTNVTLSADVNRGMTVDNAGVFCPDGVALTTYWPLRLAGEFCKQGRGTLRLGGAISYGADGTESSGAMRVTDGTLGVLSDAAVAGLAITFSNDVCLAVGPSLSRGLTVAPVVQDAPDGSGGRIRLTIDSAAAMDAKPDRIETVVATLPQGSPDLTASVGAVERVRGYGVPQLVKRTVEIDSVTYDQYVLEAVRQGLILIFR